MEKFFGLKKHGTTVRTEVLAGITTFMAMAYILMVNAGMFGNLGDGYYNAVYIATAISAVIGTESAARTGLRHGSERIFRLLRLLRHGLLLR